MVSADRISPVLISLVLAAAAPAAHGVELTDRQLSRIWSERIHGLNEPRAILQTVEGVGYYFVGACAESIALADETPTLTARRLRALDKFALLQHLQNEHGREKIALDVTGMRTGAIRCVDGLACLLAYVPSKNVQITHASGSIAADAHTERIDAASGKTELFAEAEKLQRSIGQSKRGSEREYRLLYRLYMAAGELESADRAMDEALRAAARFDQ